MGLFDKAKELAKSGAEAAKTGAANAKQSFDEKSARADAVAIERENEGLSQEEIVAKDKAKTVITFSKFEMLIDVDRKHREDYKHGFEVKFTNTSDKRVKYVKLVVDSINSVQDVIATENFEITGPFESGKKGEKIFGSAFDKNSKEIRLKKVTIQFFDGDDVVFEEKWVDRLVKIGTGASLINFVKA